MPSVKILVLLETNIKTISGYIFYSYHTGLTAIFTEQAGNNHRISKLVVKADMHPIMINIYFSCFHGRHIGFPGTNGNITAPFIDVLYFIIH